MRPKREGSLRRIATVIAILAFALALSCDGSGCLPGDYITACSRACNGRVQLVVPRSDICVCREGVPAVSP